MIRKDYMFEIIVNWFIPFALTFFCGIMVSNMKKIIATNKAIKESIITILHSQITDKIEKCLAKGYLPTSMRTCIDLMYTQYKTLGGNHGLDELVKQCFKLPPPREENE